MRPSTRPTMKPSTAAIRANFTSKPISLRTTKTTTATINAMTISSVRMDLIRDLGDLLGRWRPRRHRPACRMAACQCGPGRLPGGRFRPALAVSGCFFRDHSWSRERIKAQTVPHPPCGLCTAAPAGDPYIPRQRAFMKPQLNLRDGLLALGVVFVWGTNFVVIRLGLDVLPPLFFATLRFVFVLLPGCLLLPRPRVAWGNLAFYGLAIGFGQFGL